MKQNKTWVSNFREILSIKLNYLIIKENLNNNFDNEELDTPKHSNKE